MTDLQRWARAADLLRMLGHPVRLALLEALSKAPRCVTDIQELLDVRQANASQHLAVLRDAEIVACHEHGNVRCYYLLRPQLVRDVLRLAQREHPIVRQTPEQVRMAATQRNRQRRGGDQP